MHFRIAKSPRQYRSTISKPEENGHAKQKNIKTRKREAKSRVKKTHRTRCVAPIVDPCTCGVISSNWSVEIDGNFHTCDHQDSIYVPP